MPRARLLPHLTDDGYVVSAQNGLNELVIAEIVGARADDRLLRQFRRRLPGAGRRSTTAAAAPWWSARSTARVTPRVAGAARAAARLRAERAVADAEHLGLSLGQAGLRRDAVRHRAHQRVDRRRARRSARYRPAATSRWRARSWPWRRRARRAARGVQRLRSRAPSARRIARPRRERSLDALVALQPPLGQDAQRHLARPRGPQAARPRSTRSSAPSSSSAAEAGVPTPLTARLVELIHEIERRRAAAGARGRSRRAGRHADRQHGPRHEHRLQRPDRHRHRRRARLRPRDRRSLRRARRARLGLRRARRRACARPSAAVRRALPTSARARRDATATRSSASSPRRRRARARSTSW